MVVGALGGRTELAIIGGGPGGYVAALRGADAGLDVTLIDSGPLGGTCLNTGCIPSKTLLDIAGLRSRALAVPALGLSAAAVDMASIRDHLDSVTGGLRHGLTSLLSDAGVTVMAGTASFVRFDRLSIQSGDEVSHLEFDNVVVATGSRPGELAGFERGGRVVDSQDLLACTILPNSLLVIGGGYIGVELSTAFADLGTRVSIVEARDRLLPDLPIELSRVLQRELRSRGIDVFVGDAAIGQTKTCVELASGQAIETEVVLVAVGRTPNSDRCGLTSVGVEITASGHVLVGSDMLAAPNIYAIGDLVAGPALAHKATAEAEVAVANIVGRPATFSPAAIPQVVYSRPQVVSVGLTPEQAAQAGHSTHRFPHTASARAATLSATQGVTLIVCDSDGTVIGVHAVGHDVAELAGQAALAIEMAATVEDLALTIHAHPTMAETLSEAAWVAHGAPLHIRR